MSIMDYADIQTTKTRKQQASHKTRRRLQKSCAKRAQNNGQPALNKKYTRFGSSVGENAALYLYIERA